MTYPALTDSGLSVLLSPGESFDTGTCILSDTTRRSVPTPENASPRGTMLGPFASAPHLVVSQRAPGVCLTRLTFKTSSSFGPGSAWSFESVRCTLAMLIPFNLVSTVVPLSITPKGAGPPL